MFSGSGCSRNDNSCPSLETQQVIKKELESVKHTTPEAENFIKNIQNDKQNFVQNLPGNSLTDIQKLDNNTYIVAGEGPKSKFSSNLAFNRAKQDAKIKLLKKLKLSDANISTEVLDTKQTPNKVILTLKIKILD